MTTNTNDPNPVQTTDYGSDARAKIVLIRQVAGDFVLPEGLTVSAREHRIATATPGEFVRKATNFAAVVPDVGAVANSQLATMQDSDAYITAYDALADELLSAHHVVRKAVLFRKSKLARGSRSIYQIAKKYIATDGGDDAKFRVQELKKVLHRSPRSAATPEQPVPPAPPTPSTPQSK